ncbi:hypothetical protein BDR07DRAFT_1464058 [Suillus spraguei]|nr:hypothetical protein BDR07DRAFT_1464058 [Suillus spraguei]
MSKNWACQNSASPKAPQLNTLEHELMKSIEELTTRRRIIGGPLTADEILDPQQEKNVEEVTAYEDDDAIVAEVQRRQAIRSGELVEVESDDEDDPPKKKGRSIAIHYEQVDCRKANRRDTEGSGRLMKEHNEQTITIQFQLPCRSLLGIPREREYPIVIHFVGNF